MSAETEYESWTSSDEEDEDETPPQEATPTTSRPEKGIEKIRTSPGRPQRPKVDTLGLGAAAQL